MRMCSWCWSHLLLLSLLLLSSDKSLSSLLLFALLVLGCSLYRSEANLSQDWLVGRFVHHHLENVSNTLDNTTWYRSLLVIRHSASFWVAGKVVKRDTRIARAIATAHKARISGHNSALLHAKIFDCTSFYFSVTIFPLSSLCKHIQYDPSANTAK